MLDKNEIVQIADYVLSMVVNTFNEHGVTLPERRYLSVGGRGEVPHDTEQVTVTVEQMYSGLPGQQALSEAKVDDPRSAVVVVEVVRKIPTTNPDGTDVLQTSRWEKLAAGQGGSVLPLLDPAVLSDFARTQMRDMVLLLDAGMRAGQLEQIGALADVSAGTASGAYQAMVLTLTTSSLGHRF